MAEAPSTSSAQDNVSEAEKTEAINEVLTELIEDATLGFCFHVHRALAFGYIPLQEYDIVNGEFVLHDPAAEVAENRLKVLQAAARDTTPIFTTCPHCSKKIEANSQFTTHLRKCMYGDTSQNKDADEKSSEGPPFNCDIGEMLFSSARCYFSQLIFFKMVDVQDDAGSRAGYELRFTRPSDCSCAC